MTEQKQQQHWACINGTLMRAEEARISVFDSGFMQGIGLFETLRAYNHVPFRLQRHLDRLNRSAQLLGWSVLPDPDQVIDHVHQVLLATRDDEARLRITVTTGSLHPSAGDVPDLTVVVTAGPRQRYPAELYRDGATAVVSTCRQGPHDPLAGHKTTSYFGRLASLRAAHSTGAHESLWLTPDDHVAEGAISNIFAVRDEQVLTPPADTPVLPGITRATVMELAVEQDIPVKEAPLTLEELLDADEVFVTNAMAEVLPVVRVGRKPIGNEKVGEITRQLGIAYGNLLDRECGVE